ncbi:MAG: glycosyltransferase family 2 protein [Flavobacteriaceae bacterium]|nr:glycosyltransferase family 2 protein [Flavobacteriaceae bacterium]
MHDFQNYEFISLQAVTMGSFGIKEPFMCNGANLCYKKSAFYQVGGFDGNKEIAGGDDLFLLEKMIKNFPTMVLFNKNRQAIVQTGTSDTWKGFVQQRVRWASKTSAYKKLSGKITGLIVFLSNLMLVSLFFLSLIKPLYFIFLLEIALFKLVIDLLLILPVLKFFRQKLYLPYYVLSSLCYPFVHVFVGLRSLGGFTWKGRALKK